MSISQRLDLKIGTSLVMTPQLQQAIKLLQLSAVELQEYVDQEIEQNPLLEREDGEGAADGPADDRQPSGEGEAPATEASAPVVDGPDDKPSDQRDVLEQGASAEAFDDAFDSEYDNVWTNADAATPEPSLPSWDQAGRGAGGRVDDDELELTQTYSRPPDLREHLLAQIPLEIAGTEQRLVAAALLDSLNEAGYIESDPTELAAALGCEIGVVEAVLTQLQRLDPPGIFARNLVECLRLQLEDRNRYDPAMAMLLDNLDLLAARDIGRLRQLCGVDDDDLREMITELRALDPKPAASFDMPAAAAVIPDIFVRPHPKAGWLVELNPDALPRVLVNQSYYAEVSGLLRERGDKDYLSGQYQSANWLVKSLHQRATTILKVAIELVRQQDGFFRHGVQALKPLVLRDIAEAVEMHESTISRVTTNKYLSCPRGIFELKYFFTSAIAGADGADSYSAEAVKHRIRTLIDAEKPEKILSDDTIVDMLRAEGMDIARRTVAKYREAMRIPSSVQRRREKRFRY